jgi:hypothetical protein
MDGTAMGATTKALSALLVIIIMIGIALGIAGIVMWTFGS